MIQTSRDFVTTTFARGPHATVCEVRVEDYVGVGDSKRAPGDKSDQQIGDSLAFGRALKVLSDEILREANESSALLNPEPEPKPEPLTSVVVLSPGFNGFDVTFPFGGDSKTIEEVFGGAFRQPVLDVEPGNVDGVAATIKPEYAPRRPNDRYTFPW